MSWAMSGGALSRTGRGIPIVHELKVTGSVPSCSIVVQATREVCWATIGSPLGRITGTMTVEEVKAGDTTSIWSFRA